MYNVYHCIIIFWLSQSYFSYIRAGGGGSQKMNLMNLIPSSFEKRQLLIQSSFEHICISRRNFSTPVAGLHLFKNLLLSTSHFPPWKLNFFTPVAGLHLFRNLLLSTSHTPPRKSDFSTPVAGLHPTKNFSTPVAGLNLKFYISFIFWQLDLWFNYWH